MIASRSLSCFSILVMPVIQAVIFGFSTRTIYASEASVGFSFFMFLPLLIITAMIISFLPPTLLAIEGTAYSYVGSLPLKKKELYFAKIILSLSPYLVSLLVLSVILLLTTLNLVSTFIILRGIYIFPVLSSIIFEILVIIKMLDRTLPSGNLYSRISSSLLPMVISILISVITAITYFIVMILTLSETLGVISLATVSVIEFIVALMFLLRIKN